MAKIDRTQGFERGRKYIISIDLDLWKTIKEEIIRGITRENTTHKRVTFENYLHGKIKNPPLKKIEYIEEIIERYKISPNKFWGKLNKDNKEK